MDELLRYAPLAISVIALAVALGARRTKALSSPPARAHPVTVDPSASIPTSLPTTGPGAPSSPGRPSLPSDEACRTILEERIGALESRLAALATAIDDAAAPPAEDVAPMRPPVPLSVEPVSAPRSGWRMFP